MQIKIEKLTRLMFCKSQQVVLVFSEVRKTDVKTEFYELLEKYETFLIFIVDMRYL